MVFKESWYLSNYAWTFGGKISNEYYMPAWKKQTLQISSTSWSCERFKQLLGFLPMFKQTDKCKKCEIVRQFVPKVERMVNLMLCTDTHCVLQHRECIRTAPRRGWKTINTNGKKTSLNNFGCHTVCVCALQHRECKRTAPRRGWITINTKGKKTPLNNFGCQTVCVCVCLCVSTAVLLFSKLN